jgi:hypothetical protein
MLLLQKNQGVWLPMESIEIKAAWRIIPEDQLESLKNFYKISKAMVPEIKGFDKNNQPIYGKFTEIFRFGRLAYYPENQSVSAVYLDDL